MSEPVNLLHEEPELEKPAAKYEDDDIALMGMLILSAYVGSRVEDAMDKTLSPALKKLDSYFAVRLKNK